MWLVWVSVVLGVFGAIAAGAAGLSAHRGRMRPDPENEGFFIPPSGDAATLRWALVSSALVAFSVIASGIATLTAG